MASPARPTSALRTLRDWSSNIMFRSLIVLALNLPYRQRLAMMGWLMRNLIAPLAGWRRRIRGNLGLIFPDLPAEDMSRLLRDVPDNIGRALIEIYSGPEFADQISRSDIRGPGLDAIKQAQAQGRSVICVSGHIGNFLAPRIALAQHGIPVAGFYQPMTNRFFNRHYVDALRTSGPLLFARNAQGITQMMRHLKKGGAVGLITDQYMAHGVQMGFLGQPARTALSAADLALRLNALLVPVYGLRKSDGISFDLNFEAPIPHSDAKSMTQALNDSLAHHVAQHRAQWFWIHRRWRKP